MKKENVIQEITDEMILRSKRIKTQIAAKYLGIPVRNIQEGLQFGCFPFGTAYRKSEWVYMIFPERLVQYKHGVDIANPAIVALHNDTDKCETIFEGDRIAQLVIMPYLFSADFVEVDNLDDTERGDGGFGSTGVK